MIIKVNKSKLPVCILAVHKVLCHGFAYKILSIYSKSCSVNSQRCQIIWRRNYKTRVPKKNVRECQKNTKHSFIICQHSCSIKRTNSVLKPQRKVVWYLFPCAGIISELLIEQNNYTVPEVCSYGSLLRQQSNALCRKALQIKWDSCQSGERLFTPET